MRGAILGLGSSAQQALVSYSSARRAGNWDLVKLPRVGIEPLDVLGLDGDSLEKLGSIVEVWTSPAAYPLPGAPAPAAGISGSRSSDLDMRPFPIASADV